MSSTGIPIQPQKRLLRVNQPPREVVGTPTARVRLSDIDVGGEHVGEALIVGPNGVETAVASSTPEAVAAMTIHGGIPSSVGAGAFIISGGDAAKASGIDFSFDGGDPYGSSTITEA